MSNDLVPVSDMERMAGAIAKSGFFGMKTVEQAMALMLIAQAEGRHPATAAQEYHVIQGKPALKADAMLARFQKAGGKVEWHDYTDTAVSGTFSHPAGGSVKIAWTIDMAKKANLANKDNWKNYPRAQLRARCISEGVRTVYPGIAVGVYTPEEVQDFDDKPMKDVTPTNGEEGASPKSVYGSAKAMKAKWAEISKALTDAQDVEALTAVFVTYKADFVSLKSIDEQLYNSLVDIGTKRRAAIEQAGDLPREGSEADIQAMQGYAPEDDRIPDDEIPTFLVRGEKYAGA